MIEVMVRLDHLGHTFARNESIDDLQNRLKGSILPVCFDHGEVVVEFEKRVAVQIPHVIGNLDRLQVRSASLRCTTLRGWRLTH